MHYSVPEEKKTKQSGYDGIFMLNKNEFHSFVKSTLALTFKVTKPF